jgi:hypothetical protein
MLTPISSLFVLSPNFHLSNKIFSGTQPRQLVATNWRGCVAAKASNYIPFVYLFIYGLFSGSVNLLLLLLSTMIPFQVSHLTTKPLHLSVLPQILLLSFLPFPPFPLCDIFPNLLFLSWSQSSSWVFYFYFHAQNLKPFSEFPSFILKMCPYNFILLFFNLTSKQQSCWQRKG